MDSAALAPTLIEPRTDLLPVRAGVSEAGVNGAGVNGAGLHGAGLHGAGVIEAHDLRYAYPGDRVALDGVSLRIHAGRIVGVLGPNGGGKTTLFRVLNTSLRPAGGSLRLFGHDVRDHRQAVRRRIGVVFQSPALDVQLTPAENLLHHGHLYGLRGRTLRARIDPMLRRVGLSDRASHRVKTLSGGLRRRVELAKALLHDPQLLLLDEPSTGLDPAARADWWDVVADLRSTQGLTVLLTTHLLDEAEACDALLVIDRGRVVADDTPAALRARVGGEVLTLGGPDVAAMSRRLASIGVTSRVVGEALRVESTDAREVLGRVVTWRDLVTHATLAPPTLADAFLHLTGRRFEDRPPTPPKHAV